MGLEVEILGNEYGMMIWVCMDQSVCKYENAAKVVTYLPSETVFSGHATCDH